MSEIRTAVCLRSTSRRLTSVDEFEFVFCLRGTTMATRPCNDDAFAVPL